MKHHMLGMRFLLLLMFLGTGINLSAQNAAVQQENASLELEKTDRAKPMNIVFILTDDHRFDALGFLNVQTIFITPTLDKMGKGRGLSFQCFCHYLSLFSFPGLYFDRPLCP